MIDLFPVGDVEYPDEGKKKPIRYTEEQLQYVASTLNEVNITEGHPGKGEGSGKVIGKLKNFIFEDGMLKADAPENLDIQGYGLSPIFQGDLIDDGEFYSWLKPTIESVALTKSPRSKIIYEKVNNGDVNVVDTQELLDKKDERITSQQEEIAILKKQLKDTQKEAKAKADLEKELESTKSKLDEAQKTADEFKEDAKIFRETQQVKKEEIIKSLVGDDQDGAEKFKDLPLDTLEYMVEKTNREEPHEPTQSTNPIGDDGSITPDEPKKDEDMTYEELDEKYGSVL